MSLKIKTLSTWQSRSPTTHPLQPATAEVNNTHTSQTKRQILVSQASTLPSPNNSGAMLILTPSMSATRLKIQF